MAILQISFSSFVLFFVIVSFFVIYSYYNFFEKLLELSRPLISGSFLFIQLKFK